MALPPASVLLDPVTCMPSWIGKYKSLSTKLVSSGCPIDANGNAPCDPQAMANAAGQAIGQTVSLEAYTLARNMTSEVGTVSPAEGVAVGLAAIHKSGGNALKALLYNQAPGHLNYGHYGPIHKIVNGVRTSPYGRWAATSLDPSVANLMLAIAITNGEIADDFSKGGNDQYGPQVFLKDTGGLAKLVNDLKAKGTNHVYWVGPLPGINHFRTMVFTTRTDVDPNSPLGQQLINRAIAAIQGAAPNWSSLPICDAGGQPIPGSGGSAMTAFDLSDKGLLATVIGALLTVGGILAAVIAIRHRR